MRSCRDQQALGGALRTAGSKDADLLLELLGYQVILKDFIFEICLDVLRSAVPYGAGAHQRWKLVSCRQ
jgi:hypothetical protein